MKTHLLIIVLIVFSACSSGGGSDDGGTTTVTESALLGTWKLQSHTLDGQSMSNSQDILYFTSNHRVKVTYPQDNNVSDYANWSLSGSNLTIHWDNADSGSEYYHLKITSVTTQQLKWETTIPQEGLLKETYTKQ